MFYGEYEHTFDEKNRLTLPARFRHALAGGVVLARGIERNIDVFPSESWQANVARIAELDSLTREARDMKRYVFSGASSTVRDACSSHRTWESMPGSARTSSSRECTTTSRSGIAPNGQAI
jgi:division/cell wall cluster transcriptional repressor MraZ